MFKNLFTQSGLSLERLKTFREIVAAGGITAAAGDDSNRQSQFSRQLKELERYFGVELLKRGHGPVTLTDAGQRFMKSTATRSELWRNSGALAPACPWNWWSAREKASFNGFCFRGFRALHRPTRAWL